MYDKMHDNMKICIFPCMIGKFSGCTSFRKVSFQPLKMIFQKTNTSTSNELGLPFELFQVVKFTIYWACTYYFCVVLFEPQTMENGHFYHSEFKSPP